LKQSAADIAAMCEDFIANEHCTDAYFATGFFSEKKPIYETGNRSIFFDLSSLTKMLLTCPACFDQLGEEGVRKATLADLTLPTSLTHLQTISVASLLQHKSGLPFWINFY